MHIGHGGLVPPETIGVVCPVLLVTQPLGRSLQVVVAGSSSVNVFSGTCPPQFLVVLVIEPLREQLLYSSAVARCRIHIPSMLCLGINVLSLQFAIFWLFWNVLIAVFGLLMGFLGLVVTLFTTALKFLLQYSPLGIVLLSDFFNLLL